ncbi:MAG: zinc dependent phospholipase C family protein [Phycisphaerae bacterium]|nr:zinc dependent phospholipase C family protein [Phycisphaerae bacterium]
MRRRTLTFIFSIALLVLFWNTSTAIAWGPGTHVKLAADLLANLELLPAGVAALLAAHRRAFTYGNVATDTVLAKKLSKVKQVCHRWATGFGLLESAESDEGRAFAWGYLAHLAADTVAHNKFLPRQLAVARSTIGFGHFYWEVRADSLVTRPQWDGLRLLLRSSYPEPERLLRAHLTATMLSFGTNRLIFKQMNMLASEQAWRRSVDFWARLSRFSLDQAVIHDYHHESIHRIIDVLTLGKSSVLLHEDPNGNAALAYARAQRRQIFQMKRAKLPDATVIREAAAGHAPRPNRAIQIRSADARQRIDLGER